MQNSLFLLLGLLLIWSCNPKAVEETQTTESEEETPTVLVKDTVPIIQLDYDSTQWLDLTDLDNTILLDIRYATDNNFVGEVLYDCGRCFLRPDVARQVVAAHQDLREKGLGLKMFDCYRPRPIQYKMWEIYPQPGYVADPRKGSIHNRGGAVDLTIVDQDGNELDMGTDFDHFGKEANHTYLDLSKEILNNRKMLRDLMYKYGLDKIRTEWWHYNYRAEQFELAEWVWPCKN